MGKEKCQQTSSQEGDTPDILAWLKKTFNWRFNSRVRGGLKSENGGGCALYRGEIKGKEDRLYNSAGNSPLTKKEETS